MIMTVAAPVGLELSSVGLADGKLFNLSLSTYVKTEVASFLLLCYLVLS